MLSIFNLLIPLALVYLFWWTVSFYKKNKPRNKYPCAKYDDSRDNFKI